MCWRTERGQATVEAAVLIPVLLLVLLMLIQPGIILYDSMVMRAAAAEGCRLAATLDEAGPFGTDECIELVKRHLGAVPEQELFHRHEGGCSWHVELEGGSANVRVTIANEVRLLPLFDAAGALAGIAPDGVYAFEVSCEARAKPYWFTG